MDTNKLSEIVDKLNRSGLLKGIANKTLTTFIEQNKSEFNIVDLGNASGGSLIFPKVKSEKNIILSRALTYLSEDAEDFSLAREIFNELASLMDE